MDSGLVVSFHTEGNELADSVLVMLHGMNSHSGTWRRNLPNLSGGRRVIAPSLPPGRPWQISVEVYASYLEELLSLLDVDRLSLLGNSLGGSIAISFAARQPARVRALILEDAALPWPSEEADRMLSKISETGIPELVVWGEKDSVIPLAVGRRLASSLANSEFLVIREVGHVPHWYAQAEFNGAVAGFLARHRL